MKHLGGWLVRARLEFFAGIGLPKRKKPSKNFQKSSRNLGPRLQGKGKKKHVSNQTKEEKGPRRVFLT